MIPLFVDPHCAIKSMQNSGSAGRDSFSTFTPIQISELSMSGSQGPSKRQTFLIEVKPLTKAQRDAYGTSHAKRGKPPSSRTSSAHDVEQSLVQQRIESTGPNEEEEEEEGSASATRAPRQQARKNPPVIVLSDSDDTPPSGTGSPQLPKEGVYKIIKLQQSAGVDDPEEQYLCQLQEGGKKVRVRYNSTFFPFRWASLEMGKTRWIQEQSLLKLR